MSIDTERKAVKARFDRDTASHELTVVRDDGLYRHVSFGQTGSRYMRVDVVTWPGYLVYSGDMDCFVFSRNEDMFAFFRGARINPGYWAKKIQACSRGGVTEWSRTLFAERARDELEMFLAEDVLEEAVVRPHFQLEVLGGLRDKAKERAYSDIGNFEVEGEYPFSDFYEINTDVHTFHYLWCCYALVRIIELYDEARGCGACRSPRCPDCGETPDP